jgi:hypothetical protein
MYCQQQFCSHQAIRLFPERPRHIEIVDNLSPCSGRTITINHLVETTDPQRLKALLPLAVRLTPCQTGQSDRPTPIA